MLSKRINIILSLLMLSVMTLTAQPQLTPKEDTLRMGQMQWKYATTAHFHITNTGNEPLLLTNVEPGCACTVTSWTTTPIDPNATGEILVTYDAKQLGHFDREVAVYSNATEQPLYLRLTGHVVERVTDLSITHPYSIGDIRLDTLSIDFPDAGRGENPQFRLGIANAGEQPLHPVIMHLPAYISQVPSAEMLQPGEVGDILLTLQGDSLLDYGMTQANVYLSRYEGDVVGEDNELPLSVVILPDFSHLTQAEKDAPPTIWVSETSIDLSLALATKDKARQQLIVRNDGRSPLLISKIQVLDPSVSVNLKKNLLQPGEEAKMRVDVNLKRRVAGNRQLGLLLITNDYQHPKVQINIKTD